MLKPHHHTYKILKYYLDFKGEVPIGEVTQKFTGRVLWATDKAVHLETKPSGARIWVPMSQIFKMQEIDEFRVELIVTDWIYQQKKDEILNQMIPVKG